MTGLTTMIRIKSLSHPQIWYSIGEEFEVYANYATQANGKSYLIPVGINNRIIYLKDCAEI